MSARFFALAVCVTSIPAFAVEVTSRPLSVKIHSIYAENVKALKITLATKVIDGDACNSYGLLGEYRASAPLPQGASELYRPYFGNFFVSKTELFCLPNDQPAKEITLSAVDSFPADKNNTVGLELWLPTELEITKIEEVK